MIFGSHRAHRNNIHRYPRLLKSNLSDVERQFIERRLTEEQTRPRVCFGRDLPARV